MTDILTLGGRVAGAARGVRAILEGEAERLKRRPENIANIMLFPASDAAIWITGIYPVNGGFFAL